MVAIDITVVDVIVYVIAGAIIGALARLLVPGRQEMSVVVTILLGIVAAVVGGCSGRRCSRITTASPGSAPSSSLWCWWCCT